SHSLLQTFVSRVSFLPPGSLPAALSASARPNARLVYALLLEWMLNVLSASPSLYHSPTTWPLRMTSRPPAPSTAAAWSHASLSLSQSTPALSRTAAFSAALGSPAFGSRLRQPPWLSGGGK